MTTSENEYHQDDEDDAKLRIPPLENNTFLYLFGREDSKPLTKMLLNAILREAGFPPVETIDQISADKAVPGGVKCKTPRCDVVVVSSGDVYDIESQGSGVHVQNKALVYANELMAEYLPKGGDRTYRRIPQVVVATLLHGRVLFPDRDDFIAVSSITWDAAHSNQLATDRMRFIVVEMDKVRVRYNANSAEVLCDESLALLYLLAKGYQDDEEVKGLMEVYEDIEEFAKRYGIATDDPDLKAYYKWYLRETMFYNMDMDYAREEGLTAGREEGREVGREEGRNATLAAVRTNLQASGYDAQAIDAILAGI